MAWPCISRVCCLARFWSQLDKSDLSVPLTIHSYSDLEEPEEGASPARGGGSHKRGPAAPPGPQPFAAETQYQQDFRAWPLGPEHPPPSLVGGEWRGGHRGRAYKLHFNCKKAACGLQATVWLPLE
uniref:Uncharacterized protein n=1 Tax=Gopherus agassizii TaxID=38772 RepID=A0A452HR73_9SAUR